MSEQGITLSDNLIHGVMNIVMEHDESAAQDMVRALQYLAAVTGYLAADYPGPEQQRNELLDYLHEFSRHVADEKAASKKPGENANVETQEKGKCEASADNPAMGVWKPQ